jgi:hypothetical protein
MADSRPSNGISMTYATSAPATSGGQPGSPVRFAHFFWRRGGVTAAMSNVSNIALI